MQNPDEMLYLLQTIKHGANVSSSLLSQLGFAGIGRLCVEAQKAELIIKGEKGYRITDKGRQYIRDQNDRMGRKGLDKEIAKLPSAQCTQISVNSIYLPEDF